MHSLLAYASTELDGHVEQFPGPVTFLKVAPVQASQMAPSEKPEKPTLQVQFANSFEPSRELVPAGHVVHVLLDLYWPAPQITHGPTLGPTYPGWHWHCVTSVLPSLDIAYVGQSVQLWLPDERANLPAAQA